MSAADKYREHMTEIVSMLMARAKGAPVSTGSTGSTGSAGSSAEEGSGVSGALAESIGESVSTARTEAKSKPPPPVGEGGKVDKPPGEVSGKKSVKKKKR